MKACMHRISKRVGAFLAVIVVYFLEKLNLGTVSIEMNGKIFVRN